MIKNWRVDFKEKGPDHKNFHKAFTFALAEDEEAAKRRVLKYRRHSTVVFLGCKEVPR